MEDYINIARQIFSGTRYNASDEDVKRSSSGSCILVPDVFLPVIHDLMSWKRFMITNRDNHTLKQRHPIYFVIELS
jgi:hypothetical protein